MNFSSILTDLCHCARNITWRNQHFVSHSFPKCTLKNIFLFFRCTTPLLVNSVANPIPSSGQKIFRCLVHNFALPLQQLRYIYVSIKGMSLWFLSKYIIQLHRACTCPLSFWPRLAKRRGPSIDYCFSLTVQISGATTDCKSKLDLFCHFVMLLTVKFRLDLVTW